MYVYLTEPLDFLYCYARPFSEVLKACHAPNDFLAEFARARLALQSHPHYPAYDAAGWRDREPLVSFSFVCQIYPIFFYKSKRAGHTFVIHIEPLHSTLAGRLQIGGRPSKRTVIIQRSTGKIIPIYNPEIPEEEREYVEVDDIYGGTSLLCQPLLVRSGRYLEEGKKEPVVEKTYRAEWIEGEI